MPGNTHSNNATDFIFASLLTGVYDVNRNEVLEKDNFATIQKWYDSIVKLKLNAIVFHNAFSKEIIKKYANDYVQFIEVAYDEKLNPNVFRYFIYQDFIRQYSQQINHLFITDITDVEVINDPFESSIFIENSDCLFCGDEPKLLDNEWMQAHNDHLRNSMPEFSIYEALNKNKPLLNCGVIGANITVMKLLLDKMVDMHKAYSSTNKTAYTLDMGVFNYIARTVFADKILHGKPVNTVFKKYESERADCWFRHK
ncbi:MAG: hypothetical protein ABIP30_07560 [Ferruginibacter sp.]